MSDVLELPADTEPAPLATEHCEICGCLVEDLEEVIFLCAADMVAQWQRDDPRDAWRHSGDLPPKTEPQPRWPARKAYKTPEATIDAFWYVARNHDAEYLARWLDNHPDDIATLTKLWEAKHGLS
jgi:hypothetical protein